MAVSSTGSSGTRHLGAARGLGPDAKEKIHENPFPSGPCLSDYKTQLCPSFTTATGGRKHRGKWRLQEVVFWPR